MTPLHDRVQGELRRRASRPPLLDFLREDLAKHVGTSGRPVIVFQHFAWVGGMADWWQLEAKERFYEVVKPYRVACLINGHSHGASFAPWHD